MESEDLRHRTRELEMQHLVNNDDSHNDNSSAVSGILHNNILLGLSVAGVASTLLSTTYSMFHVEVFLRGYSLPLPTYSWGSLVVSLINTVNDLASAWAVDHFATTRSRSDYIGVAGCVFALCFMTPYFRWRMASSWDAAHFIFSMSLYDTLYSFVIILMESIVNDNHHMTDQMRMQFIASGKAANLVAAFIVARIGLSVLDEDNLMPFRIFVTFLALFVALLFLFAQRIVSQNSTASSTPATRQGVWEWLLPQKHWHDDSEDLVMKNTGPPSKLRWRQVIADFYTHKNFWAWIGMEILLEAQYKFMINFLKTFVDGLILKEDDTATRGMTRAQCDMFLSMVKPMTLIAGILVYFPIQKYTYPQVYRMLFYCNILLSVLMLLFVNLEGAPNHAVYWITLYLCTYPIITGAVRSAGFQLAQADMVLEMKRKHASDDRHDEPSLAGLFLGANMFFCKPCESILPITAAQTLQRNGSSKTSLFYLLVIPPIVCSMLQLVAWRRYDLTPTRTTKMREELRIYQELRTKRINNNGRERHTERPLSPFPD
jgi:hypothetical protein